MRSKNLTTAKVIATGTKSQSDLIRHEAEDEGGGDLDSGKTTW